MSDDHQLEKSLALGPAIGLAITMVVGSGLLVLPGLTAGLYLSFGPKGFYAIALFVIGLFLSKVRK
jgi:hypothetical protein